MSFNIYSAGTVNGVYTYGNTYNGGTSNDTLNGSAYGDRYQFNLGDGQDLIDDTGSHQNTVVYADIISFGEGIRAVRYQRGSAGQKSGTRPP